ncbi:MAG: energy-coupling factor transporter ATPase [Methanosarcinaceae archaeon]|nr:energy-coupling factor transporter ATPase [Methanosarcinaceae archaeon]MDF1534371.1 energy-coupling factor transporter ATPase [Methanosarcinaceae archaeon]
MIRINNLSYTYPDRTLALDGVDLSIEKGEFVALIGKNGCGKTTLVRHLNALLMPTSGSISVFGMDTTDTSNVWNIRQTVGMVFQNPQTQFVGTTLEEDVAFGPENLALPQNEIQERVDRSLREVDLLEYKTYSPKTLSGGQMQRAAIAGILAMEPQCIVLDEVTSMLDPQSRSNVLDTIAQLHQSGKTIIYVTQRIEEILPIADRIISMNNGRIEFVGTPKEYLASVESPIPAVTSLMRKLKAKGFDVNGNVFTVDDALLEITKATQVRDKNKTETSGNG